MNVIVPEGITFVDGAAVTLTLSEKTDSSETDSGTDSRQDADSQSGTAEQKENPDRQEEEEQNGQ